MYTCFGVTCHLHLWRNDRGLLRATAVTREWNRVRIRVSTKKLTLNKRILPPLSAGIRTRNLSITSPVLLPTSYPGGNDNDHDNDDIDDDGENRELQTAMVMLTTITIFFLSPAHILAGRISPNCQKDKFLCFYHFCVCVFLVMFVA